VLGNKKDLPNALDEKGLIERMWVSNLCFSFFVTTSRYLNFSFCFKPKISDIEFQIFFVYFKPVISDFFPK
jgi:hypothetical protein